MVNSLSAWLGAGTERVLMTVGGAVGAAFSFAFGDVAPLMLWLAIFVTADMVTGMLAAIKNKAWDGKVLFWGVIRKVVMFSIIALAHGLDITLHDLIHIDFVQSVVIVAYTAGEFGSVIKNLEKEVELSRLYRRIADLERERMNPYSPLNTPIFPNFPKYSNNWWENPIT